MNHNEAEKILRTSVENLSEPLKSAVEFTLKNFFTPSATELAKKFLASLPSMTTEDAELKSRIDSAYFTIMKDENFWLALEDLPHEQWRNVSGYEEHYQISNLGRVKSLKRGRQKILKVRFYRDEEYLAVELFMHSKSKIIKIHRLVAEVFVPNPDGKPQVNHVDGNKLNNRMSNLEWVTVSENIRHAYYTGLIKKKSGCEHPDAKFTEEQIRYIRKVYKPFDKEFGMNALSRKFNTGLSTICRIVNGESYKNVT